LKPKSQVVDEVIERHGTDRSALIPQLQDIQASEGYLAESTLEELSKKTNLSLSVIYGVATFYAQFHFQPHGKHTVRVCRGTACHVRGGKEIQKTVENNLKIKDGETTSDLKFSLETVACLGACALAPVMVIDQVFYGNMSSNRVQPILEQYRSKK
jgi:NADH-quinone oxidoreductase subunit E